IVLEHLPHNLLPQAFTSFPTSASHRPENMTLRNPRHRRPRIDRHLDPGRQWSRADPAVLTNEIHNAPATIALLNMSERKCRDLRSPEAAAEKNSQHGAVTESPHRGYVWGTQQILRLPQ